MIFYFVFKSIMLLLKPVLAIGTIIIAVITAGAFIAAVFSVFPVAGIILAAIAVSIVVCKTVLFIKDKKKNIERS